MAEGRAAAAEVPGAQAVRRAMAVLRIVAMGQDDGVRLVDISAMSGLSRPTVHRLLKVLIEETAVEQDPQTRRYRAGDELPLLGLARGGRLPMRALAEPYLQALAAEVGDTVFLSVRHGADSVCVARCPGTHAIQVLSIPIGARRPLGASVSGLVLLAALPPPEADALTQANATRLQLLQRDPDEVRRQVRAARRAGHAHAPHGVMPGTAALGVPVRDAQGHVVAAISVAALRERLDRPRLPAVLAAMQQQALLVGRRHDEVHAPRGHGAAPSRKGP